jgi:hypothetical protein
MERKIENIVPGVLLTFEAHFTVGCVIFWNLLRALTASILFIYGFHVYFFWHLKINGIQILVFST